MSIILFKIENCKICNEVSDKLSKIIKSETFKDAEIKVVTLSKKTKQQFNVPVVPAIISFSKSKKSQKEIKRIVGVDVLPNLENFLKEHV